MLTKSMTYKELFLILQKMRLEKLEEKILLHDDMGQGREDKFHIMCAYFKTDMSLSLHIEKVEEN